VRAVTRMAKRKLRKCPQCGGNMFLYTDLDNWYAECVECSYRHDLMTVADAEEPLAQTEEERADEERP
jgi:predicted  nucleic acid-binding Zn-ribbon protein